MKRLSTLLLTATAVFAFNMPVANAMDKSTELKLVQLCEAAKSNSLIRLQTKLKKYRLTYKDIAQGLVCNGHDVVTFSKLHDATDTASMIVKNQS